MNLKSYSLYKKSKKQLYWNFLCLISSMMQRRFVLIQEATVSEFPVFDGFYDAEEFVLNTKINLTKINSGMRFFYNQIQISRSQKNSKVGSSVSGVKNQDQTTSNIIQNNLLLSKDSKGKESKKGEEVEVESSAVISEPKVIFNESSRKIQGEAVDVNIDKKEKEEGSKNLSLQEKKPNENIENRSTLVGHPNNEGVV
eukprot:CAMPEP_0170538100 /NCGR_PEP_ID=MMETSP0209-20121228/103107_1 /TAXON_ID=665100 ORGANISM="Litonotus pictus, Strain P1" /NCGR_SAMPLE_ID=MMETSP0209 /ASSEMBLY_ACC=CAM_ASM_000301 /LENGTH=197 /DNA_ID=CAMNT_0010839727 /DNA_START=2722 /DNA_END=3312 /DNA_ORIENTATION=-